MPRFRTAVVVVHGMGQQQRNQTRDAVVDGLLGGPGAVGRPSCGAPHACRCAPLPLVGPAGTGHTITLPGESTPYESKRIAGGDREADFYDAYWAPLMRGMATFPGLMTALIRDTLRLPTFWDEMPGVEKRKRWRDLRYVAALAIFAALIAALVWVALALGAFLHSGSVDGGPWPRVIAQTREFFADLFGNLFIFNLQTLLEQAPFLHILLGVLFVYLLAMCLHRLLPANRRPAGDFARIVMFFLSGAVVVALIWFTPSIALMAASYALLRGLSTGIKKWFVDFAGDVQIYATYDENDARFDARETALRRLMALLQALQADWRYDRIVIVAHSLGTAFTLDALYRLGWEAELGRRRPLTKIKGLITCGTALEKVRLLRMLKTTRREDPTPWLVGLQGGDESPDPNSFRWHNIWFADDIVANRLDGGHFPEYGDGHDPWQDADHMEYQPLRFAERVWVHSNYWYEPRFQCALTQLAFGP